MNTASESHRRVSSATATVRLIGSGTASPAGGFRSDIASEEFRRRRAGRGRILLYVAPWVLYGDGHTQTLRWRNNYPIYTAGSP